MQTNSPGPGSTDFRVNTVQVRADMVSDGIVFCLVSRSIFRIVITGENCCSFKKCTFPPAFVHNYHSGIVTFCWQYLIFGYLRRRSLGSNMEVRYRSKWFIDQQSVFAEWVGGEPQKPQIKTFVMDGAGFDVTVRRADWLSHCLSWCRIGREFRLPLGVARVACHWRRPCPR